MQLGELSAHGVHGLLNPKSAAFTKCHLDANDLSEEELSEFLADKPRAIKRPILTDGMNLVVGFQKEEMSKLVHD